MIQFSARGAYSLLVAKRWAFGEGHLFGMGQLFPFLHEHQSVKMHL